MMAKLNLQNITENRKKMKRKNGESLYHVDKTVVLNFDLPIQCSTILKLADLNSAQKLK